MHLPSTARLSFSSCYAVFLLVVCAVTTMSGNARAAELITNGNFESGSFSGWTTANVRDTGGANPTGTTGGFFVDEPGTTTPEVGTTNDTFDTAANPLGGAFYAVTTAAYVGQSALLQDFTVPDLPNQQVSLSFQMFVNDQSGFGGVVDASGLDYTSGGTFVDNQHARVDILAFGASDFSTAPADVVANLYLGADGTGTLNPYITYTFDISTTVMRGQTYRLRFAEVDNLSALNLGVDNVFIATAIIPEPASLGLVAAGFAVLPTLRGRRARKK